MTDGGGTDTRPIERIEPLGQPVIVAERLGTRTRRGWVFQHVDLALRPGSVTALCGPAGSGRTMLLLTVAGRAKPSTGSLVVAGQQQRGQIRRLVGVARVTSAVELDPDLPVIAHRREAETLARGRLDYRWAAELVGLGADGADVVGELPADEAILLALALAAGSRPTALVVDDIDVATTVEQQCRVWAALAEVGAAGITVLASTIDAGIAVAAGADRLAINETEGDADAHH